jgi:uncharacterized protein (DUF302 family)
VAALGHVRSEATLEVLVAQARDLLQERDTQAGFEVPTETEQARSDRKLKQEQR